MKMFADYILIKPETRTEQKVGSIVLPDIADVNRAFCRGTVEAVGEGLYLQCEVATRIPPSMKPGDKVLYFKDQAIPLLVKNRDMHIVRERQVIGVFEPGDADAVGLPIGGYPADPALNVRGV